MPTLTSHPAAETAAVALPTTGFRWVICTLLFAATTINYADRQILSLLKPMLDTRFQWSNTQFGWINSGFQASYGISLFLFGWVIDRYGTKLGYALSIAGWSLAAVGHAAVASVGGFLAARIALGLSEGGNFPAAVKATAQWFPKRERALAASLFNSGANVGALLAPALVPPIAAALGWHAAFVFAGAAGFLWLFAWMPLFDVPERSRRVSISELAYIESDVPDAATPGGDRRITWGSVLKYRAAWSFVAAKFLTDPVWWFFLIWLPDYFKEARGLDIKGSAPLLVGVYSIVTVLSIAGGWLSGHLIARRWSVTAARRVSQLTFALCVVPIALAPRVGNWAAVGLIGLAGAAHQAWSATLYTTVSDLFPKRAVATLVGIGSTAGSLGGVGFPVLTGLVLDRFHAAGYTIVFGFCSAAYLVGLAVNVLLALTLEPVAFTTDGSAEA